MIERNLQYVTVRKYGTAFLEAFGMLPLDYFGAVGDNITDNYANIQVAINESIKRGLEFIFVPNGTYLYSGNLLDADKIKFIGNSDYAEIKNGTTTQKIYQIGTQMPWKKDTSRISKEVTADGSFEIEIPYRSVVESYLIIDSKIIYVTDDGLITVDGELFDEQTINLGTNTTLEDIEIVPNAIKISYALSESSGTIDSTIEWRVR